MKGRSQMQPLINTDFHGLGEAAKAMLEQGFRELYEFLEPPMNADECGFRKGL
jgi:hypothetical protein